MKLADVEKQAVLNEHWCWMGPKLLKRLKASYAHSMHCPRRLNYLAEGEVKSCNCGFDALVAEAEKVE